MQNELIDILEKYNCEIECEIELNISQLRTMLSNLIKERNTSVKLRGVFPIFCKYKDVDYNQD